MSEDFKSWWQEAKFGMFIHWGLYSHLEGFWQGAEVNGIGEWIMRRMQIPVSDYEQIATQFNPVDFCAKEWVALAKAAGMKYIVITAKHHDGFALYHSKVSKYNIVDATPYGSDPIAELATECQAQGLKLCFYYSQAQDWYEENGIGNTWDFLPDDQKDFQTYLDDKVKPQLAELLTNYGQIGIIWFDTPIQISEAQSQDLYNWVKSLQPNCIVNGRTGHGKGDYFCFGDNQTPAAVVDFDWETCATLNDTWGYKRNDREWKDSKTLITILADIVSKNGTYLLNVGPDGKGVIPAASATILKEVGTWLGKHEEAIRGASPNPFDSEFSWGTVTQKQQNLYLHLFERPGDTLSISGLKNKVVNASLMADGSQVLVQQSVLHGVDVLQLTLPSQAKFDPAVTVITLELDGEPVIDTHLRQQSDGSFYLEAHKATLHVNAEASQMALGRNGIIQNWVHEKDWLAWENVAVLEPGTYQVELISQANKARDAIGEKVGAWEGGHTLSLKVGDAEVTMVANEDQRIANPRSLYFNDIVSRGGTITIPETGDYSFTLVPKQLNSQLKMGFRLKSLQLTKI